MESRYESGLEGIMGADSQDRGEDCQLVKNAQDPSFGERQPSRGAIRKNRRKIPARKSFRIMARPAGFEPATAGLEGRKKTCNGQKYQQ